MLLARLLVLACATQPNPAPPRVPWLVGQMIVGGCVGWVVVLSVAKSVWVLVLTATPLLTFANAKRTVAIGIVVVMVVVEVVATAPRVWVGCLLARA